MNNKNIIVILVLFFVALLGVQQYVIWNNPPSKEDVLIEKITQIEFKIDSLNNKKDSLRSVVDSTHVKIITNEKHYQERINTIINQPLSADSEYISNYIGRYIESHKSYFQ